MGYSMSQVRSRFSIPAANIPAVLQALRDLMDRADEIGGGGHIQNGCRIASWFSYTDPDEMRAALSAGDIEAVFAAWRWRVERSEDGGIADIEFEGENMGDDEKMWEAIAPFVEEGSFVQMTGAEGEWRWSFKGGSLHWDEPFYRDDETKE